MAKGRKTKNRTPKRRPRTRAPRSKPVNSPPSPKPLAPAPPPAPAQRLVHQQPPPFSVLAKPAPTAPSSTAGTRKQIVRTLLISLIPLIIFWIVEAYLGLVAGLIAAMVFALGELAWFYFREHRIDRFALMSAILILVLGGISLIFQKGIFFKLKPAVIEGVFAAILLISQLMGKPLLLTMATKQHGKGMLEGPRGKYLKGVNLRLGLFFLGHAGLTLYAALALSTSGWIFVKGVLQMILLGVLLLGEFLYTRFILAKRLAVE